MKTWSTLVLKYYSIQVNMVSRITVEKGTFHLWGIRQWIPKFYGAISVLRKWRNFFLNLSTPLSDDIMTTNRPVTKEDDIFAFGTLIYEIFGGILPFSKSGLSNTEISNQIRNGRIHDQLRQFPGKTEKLKRVIQSCWHYQANQRIALERLVANFTPGNCLVRRHSSSEPKLDQAFGTSSKR